MTRTWQELEREIRDWAERSGLDIEERSTGDWHAGGVNLTDLARHLADWLK